MKKFILSLALMALVSIPASASLYFRIDGAKYEGVFLSYNTEITLIKLNGDTFTSVDMTKPFSLNSLGTIICQAAPNTVDFQRKGVGLTNTTYYPDCEKNEVTAGNYVALLTHKEGDDTYYNLASEIRLLTDENVSTANKSIYEIDSFTVNEGMNMTSTLSLGGGWVKGIAVPEPATGALALAGVALLFRRRRQA